MGFDKSSFGSVVLSRTQAVGLQLELSASMKMSPSVIIEDTIVVDIGRSVGRVDMLSDKGIFPCTAFIISKKYLPTINL